MKLIYCHLIQPHGRVNIVSWPEIKTHRPARCRIDGCLVFGLKFPLFFWRQPPLWRGWSSPATMVRTSPGNQLPLWKGRSTAAFLATTTPAAHRPSVPKGTPLVQWRQFTLAANCHSGWAGAPMTSWYQLHRRPVGRNPPIPVASHTVGWLEHPCFPAGRAPR